MYMIKMKEIQKTTYLQELLGLMYQLITSVLNVVQTIQVTSARAVESLVLKKEYPQPQELYASEAEFL